MLPNLPFAAKKKLLHVAANSSDAKSYAATFVVAAINELFATIFFAAIGDVFITTIVSAIVNCCATTIVVANR